MRGLSLRREAPFLELDLEGAFAAIADVLDTRRWYVSRRVFSCYVKSPEELPLTARETV
jgi:hypothetical protein